MQLHDGQEPMIIASKLMTMNVLLNLTDIYAPAWNKTCTGYSDHLYDSWLQSYRPIGHGTKRHIVQTLLGEIGIRIELI